MRGVVVGLVLAATAPAVAAEFAGKVVAIADGDTLTVLRDRTQVKVRLHGVDAPETGQPFGAKSKQLAGDLAFGRMVTVKEHDRDRYGRTVAEVVLPDGRSLNAELVRAGLAWWYRQYAPSDERLSNLEAGARAARRGLWADPRPVPPWEWRARGRGQGKAESPGAGAAAGVIANRSSRVYHRPECRNAARIAEANRATFGSAKEAEAAGYRPGKDCHPGAK